MKKILLSLIIVFCSFTSIYAGEQIQIEVLQGKDYQQDVAVLNENLRKLDKAIIPVTNNFYVNVKDYGAVGDGVNDDTIAVQNAINSLISGGRVIFPPGIYFFTAAFDLPVSGITLEGSSSHLDSGVNPKPVQLDFSGLPDGSNGISCNGHKGIQIKNLFIYGGVGHTGGAAIKLTNVTGVELDNVNIDWYRGATSFGIQFGLDSASVTPVIIGSLRNCIVGSDGIPFLIGYGCTSINFTSCYALGGATQYKFFGATYCSLNSCAADTGLGWAYEFTSSTGIILNGCGAENNAKGFAYINGSVGIQFLACRGSGNNTSADNTIGSFLHLVDGSVSYQIFISGCVDTSPNAATVQNIYGGANNLWTTIIGYNGTSYTKGIGGDATWMTVFLTKIGGT